MPLKKQKILTVCHDAGGAEIISSYVKNHLDKADFRCLVQGPAVKIFKGKKLAKLLINKKQFTDILKRKTVSLVLAGTSGPVRLELEMIALAKQLGVKTAVFLDHWVNYRQRFGYPARGWQNNLPDEIWVGDRHAFTLAKGLFKNIKIKLKTNYYLVGLVRTYKKIKSRIKKNKYWTILFISEPVNVTKLACTTKVAQSTFDEYDLLKTILESLSLRGSANQLIIRYHPAEQKDKYNKILIKYKKLIFKKSQQTLVEDLARADLVIGIESMALVVAYLCGKKVVSVPAKRHNNFSLPYNIIKLNNIKQINRYIK